MSPFPSKFVSAVCLLSACACGYREGPPVQAPPPFVPAEVTGIVAQAPEDRPVVVLEANGDAAKVSEVFTTNAGAPNGTYAPVEALKPLCITPCRVDLSPGLHELRFASKTDRRTGTVDLNVDDRSKVVRHAMGRTQGSQGGRIAGIFLTSFGGAFMVTGAAAAGDFSERQSKRDLGLAVASVGAATLVMGVIMMAVSRPVRHAEATTEILLPRRAPSIAPPAQPEPWATDEESARRISDEAHGAPPP